MLIDNYSPKLRLLNNEDQLTMHKQYSPQTHEDTIQKKHHDITYYSTSLSVFDTDTLKEIKDEFDEQLNLVNKILDVQEEYALITKKSREETLLQYSLFFFTPTHAYLKSELLQYLQDTETEEKIEILTRPNTTHKLYGISRQDIRNITGYSYTIPNPHKQSSQPSQSYEDTITIHWQKQVLEDTSDRLVVDGSRQMGKSKVLAQLLTEESFIIGADILVCAFLQSTTDVILNYMMDYVDNFDTTTFTYKERKKCLINNVSKTRIHFRTLQDGAHNVRGLTIRLTVVDEAQLISKEIIETAVEPTMTTTGGRMVLIGTATESLDSYMYHIIESLEKETTHFNTPITLSATHIKVSVEENPLVHPKFLLSIRSRKNEPSIQREYYNHWGKLEGSLFNPSITSIQALSNITTITNTNIPYVILGIDPARKVDRSGYSINLIITSQPNHNIVTIESGFVPDDYKSMWTSQAQFYLKIQRRLQKQYPNSILYTSFDATGVGDATVPIFAQEGVTFTHLYKYSDGVTITESRDPQYQKAKTLRLGKPLLINNYLNFTQLPNYHIINELNTPLIKEIKYITLSETAKGQVAFSTKYTDDIVNATMTALYTVTYEKLIQKIDPSSLHYLSNPSSNPSKQFDDEINSIQTKTIRQQRLNQMQRRNKTSVF